MMVDSSGYGPDMGLSESLEALSIFWSIRCSMDEYW